MHGKWRVDPEDGGQVEASALALQPVDPVVYAMKDVWGFDDDELPIEPFDIEIRIQATTVREALTIFERAVGDYMLTNFDAYNRPLYLERLLWGDEFEEVKTCEIVMAG